MRGIIHTKIIGINKLGFQFVNKTGKMENMATIKHYRGRALEIIDPTNITIIISILGEEGRRGGKGERRGRRREGKRRRRRRRGRGRGR